MKKVCLAIAILFLLSPAVVLADEFDVVHRYTFDGTTEDVVGGADGTLVNNTGNAAFDTGKLVLGNTGSQSSNANNGDYVDLPNLIISDLGNAATFEAWVTWNGPTTSSWQRIFDFGSSNGGENQSPGAGNAFYIFLTPRSGDDTLRFGNNHPDPAQNETWIQTQTLASGTEQHVAVVWDGANQTATIYVNGVAAISGGGFTYPLSAINDNNNWLGRAQWPDAMFVGNYNEFRIYQTAQSADEIAASFAAGPDAVIPQVRAVNVYPPNHADLISPSAILEWQAPADVTLAGYDVYVSPDSNDLNLQLVSEDQSEATYDLANLPFALLPETEYFWRIDVRDANEGGDLIWT
ncbi:MAG: LamG domain-containing protein, partial [Sedimentisphaerales bacterium]|nr:LamG domain-containing protein [Sedimentisphaerales bacterium]